MTQQRDINEPAVDPICHDIEQTDELSFDCQGCGIDTDEIDEYYMVQFHIWETVVPKKYQRQMLCVGCLEDYLGRQLVSADFIEVPVNYFPNKSERLLNRLGDRFRALDGPYETLEAFQAASIESQNQFMVGMVETKLARVHVDTNNIILGGLTKASLRRVTTELHVGDAVIAHDIAEAADFNAVVVAIAGTKVHLRIDWDSAQRWDNVKDEK